MTIKTIKTISTARRIDDQTIPCFERRDGVQRREWVGHDGGDSDAVYGSIFKHRTDKAVWAYSTNGQRAFFSTRDFTTEQAFAEARRWLVAQA